MLGISLKINRNYESAYHELDGETEKYDRKSYLIVNDISVLNHGTLIRPGITSKKILL